MARPKKAAQPVDNGVERDYIICGGKSEFKIKDDDGNVVAVKVYGEMVKLTALRASQIGPQVVCTPEEWADRIKKQKPPKAVAAE